VIYTVGLIEPDSRDANPDLLKELSMASGGEFYRPKDSKGIANVLDKIANDIRHTYTIGYTPTNTSRDGAYRTVRVVVTAPPGRTLVVRSRTGYRAGTSTR
jgi:VWFA-related protein